ncbi:mechanosensitive ion channel family protein [Novosphingobium album (ex Hu et al. 2023)]|uniref:Mechanosensitive ion channel family protein n=1 Tax=Novosphingobium album (ex Hu et al. 2023) TaxID=2930093 RepID=A0ABT0B098_9SPHN|nr:mechanosensitive ion channel family protein [Novosphingobium album (ex Hu et al. 2023)]MCJ2178374.1 mechanosensitive ion channel family protein [Novosphingobium album (ex Hu et al. 2023)]
MQIGLLDALAKRDLAHLTRYLDVKDPTSKASLRKARTFSEVLDSQGTMLPRIDLSLRPEGNLDDGLPPDEETIGSYEQDGEIIPVLARRVTHDDETPLWLISADTLAQLPDLPEAPASEMATADLEEDHSLMLFGAPLKSWALLAGLGLTLFSVIVLVFRALCSRIGLRRGDIERHPVSDIIFAIVPPGALMLVYGAMSQLAVPLGAGLVERTAIARYSGIFVWAAATWLGWRLIGVMGDLAAWRFRRAGRVQWIGASNFLMRTLRLAMVMLGAAALLATFGIDVTAGLAALGVGGLALALGSKTAVADLVGSIVILADKPVRIGDKCKVGGRIGDVVDIGMRSTRIRTMERSILSIPNSALADKEIENLTLRDHFHVEQMFGISFDANARTIKKVLDTARAVLEADPDYVPSTCPVRFRGFGEDCFRFQIRANLQCLSHDDGYLRQERLLLELLKQLEAAGITIALPARRLELAPGPVSGPSDSWESPGAHMGTNPD